MRTKLAIVVSHPIQHFVPFYRALAQQPRLDLTVVYAARIGLERYFDPGLNTTVSWNMDMLGGYEKLFLPEADRITSTGPRQVNNPSIGPALDNLAPDVVLIYGYNHLTSLRALRWCRRRRIPAMMISDSELKTVRSRQARALKRLLLPRLLRRFDAFLTVGDCNEAYYRHYGVSGDRLFRSPFTIDEDCYRAARARRVGLRSDLREGLGIGPDKVVALYVGKLSKRKRPADVVEAARRLKDRSPELVFVMAGSGEELDRLKAECAAEDLPVIFAGFVNVDALPAYYAGADLIVHPSSRDPHPLVMSEAACIGLPLVISDRVGAAGATDIARPGENAVVFPVGDIAALAGAVARLAGDRPARDAMGARSVEIFEDLDMRRSVQGMLQAVQFLNGRKTA